VPLRYDDLVCRDAVELASDYVEGALSWRRRRSYERHLRGCPHCSAHLAQIRRIVAELGRADPERLTDDARADLVDVFRRYREEQHGDLGP
jgi:anti-sigma factor RsiW